VLAKDGIRQVKLHVEVRNASLMAKARMAGDEQGVVNRRQWHHPRFDLSHNLTSVET
jgi:hypothetical protein